MGLSKGKLLRWHHCSRRDKRNSCLGFITNLLHPLVLRCKNYFGLAGLKLIAPQLLTFTSALLQLAMAKPTAKRQQHVEGCYEHPSDELIFCARLTSRLLWSPRISYFACATSEFFLSSNNMRNFIGSLGRYSIPQICLARAELHLCWVF